MEFRLGDAGRDFDLTCAEKQKWDDIFKAQHNSVMCTFKVHSVGGADNDFYT